MAGPVLAIDYGQMSQAQLQQLCDAGVRDIWPHNTVQWAQWESQEEQFTWGALDEYVEATQAAGVRPIVGLIGVPDWADPAWLPHCGHSNCRADQYRRYTISPWSKPGTALLKDRLSVLHKRYGSADLTINPRQPGFEYWLLHELGAGCPRDNLWCYDEAALASYARFLEAHDRPVRAPERLGVTRHVDAANLGDTLAWHWESLRHFWRQLYLHCAEMGQSELWAALVPRAELDQMTADVGIFRMEDWVDELRKDLTNRNTDLNLIYFCVYLCSLKDFTFCVYVTRRYGWRVWVGAETAANIVANTRRSAELGFSGVVVGAPHAEDSPERYRAGESRWALDQIRQAVDLWHQIREVQQ